MDVGSQGFCLTVTGAPVPYVRLRDSDVVRGRITSILSWGSDAVFTGVLKSRVVPRVPATGRGGFRTPVRLVVTPGLGPCAWPSLRPPVSPGRGVGVLGACASVSLRVSV